MNTTTLFHPTLRRQRDGRTNPRPFPPGRPSTRRSPACPAARPTSRPQIQLFDLSAYLGRRGDIITIHARDRLEVVAVTATLMTTDGRVIESRAAEPVDNGWQFRAAKAAPPDTALTVQVAATNLTGGTATLASLWFPAGYV